MKKRFVLYIMLISVIATSLMFFLGLIVTHNYNRQQATDRVTSLANIYSDIYSGDTSIIVKSDENVRITLISADGKVIADTDFSDVSALDNHLSRTEIQTALSGSPEAVIRYSETYGADMMYYAIKKDILDNYAFIRASVPISSINSYLVMTLPLTIAILFFALIVSMFAGILLSGRLMKPLESIKKSLAYINGGKSPKRMPGSNDPEINKILSEIFDISVKLTNNVQGLKEESTKLDFILNNINDAVIVIDAEKNISLINDIAKSIFDCTDAIGKSINIIEYNEKLSEAIDANISDGQNLVFEMQQGHAIYLVTVKTLSAGWCDDAQLCAVIMSDITSDKESRKIRGEFFENASHELKSPLTGISGFTDILDLENKDISLNKYIGKIKKESERMLLLIEDMLKLSSLETTEVIDKKNIDLAAVAKEVVSGLEPILSDKNVTVEVTGNGFVFAEYSHMYSLIKNLVENAVRYNRSNGKVEINIKEKENSVTLKVTDTGIGIASEHQNRIFERFYRVEKSRSRKLGGTGLGLAIVKHICMLYNADITLRSRIGLGTSVTVNFKKDL